MIVIGFCGLPGSGKSTTLEALKTMGTVINMGDLIRLEAKKRNVPLIDKELGKIARELREIEGVEVLAYKCIELIEKEKKKDIIFIDGLRSIEEVEIFRKLWRFPTIAIITPENKRFELIKNRGRIDDPKSIEELRLRDNRENKVGLKEVIESADYILVNDSSKKELEKKVRRLIEKIIHNY